MPKTRYTWTAKAEQLAKELGLEERKAGTTALCGFEPVDGQTVAAWFAKGYIELEKAEQTTDIQIRAFYGEWQTVSKEKAKEFITNFMSRITTTSDFEKQCNLVDGRHLRGIATAELLGEVV